MKDRKKIWNEIIDRKIDEVISDAEDFINKNNLDNEDANALICSLIMALSTALDPTTAIWLTEVIKREKMEESFNIMEKKNNKIKTKKLSYIG